MGEIIAERRAFGVGWGTVMGDIIAQKRVFGVEWRLWVKLLHKDVPLRYEIKVYEPSIIIGPLF